MSDEKLAIEIARRSDSARNWQVAMSLFEELHHRHGNLLHAFLASRTKPNDCDDLYQLIWLKVWDKLPEQFRDGNFRAWLYTIARRTIIDHHRLARDHNTIPTNAEVSVEPDNVLLQQERASILANCLQQLERKEREILQALFSGQTYAQITQTWSVSHSVAYKMVHRAKGKLKICVERHLQ